MHRAEAAAPAEFGLALAGIEGRRQIDAPLSLFKRELPDAFRDAKVAVYGNAGIRQTRTITGRSHVTVGDIADRPLNAGGSLHQIDVAALQEAVHDNLEKATTVHWLATS